MTHYIYVYNIEKPFFSISTATNNNHKVWRNVSKSLIFLFFGLDWLLIRWMQLTTSCRSSETQPQRLLFPLTSTSLDSQAGFTHKRTQQRPHPLGQFRLGAWQELGFHSASEPICVWWPGTFPRKMITFLRDVRLLVNFHSHYFPKHFAPRMDIQNARYSVFCVKIETVSPTLYGICLGTIKKRDI